MKIYTAADKNKLQQHVKVYEGRRAQARAAGDKLRIVRLKRRIDYWNQLINNISKRNIQMVALGNKIALFMGVTLKDIGGVSSNQEMVYIAKGLFCKWGMEHGMVGVLLSEYMDLSPRTAAEIRMSFSKSLAKNIERKQYWERFKLYMADLLEDSRENGSE